MYYFYPLKQLDCLLKGHKGKVSKVHNILNANCFLLMVARKQHWRKKSNARDQNKMLSYPKGLFMMGKAKVTLSSSAKTKFTGDFRFFYVYVQASSI